MAKFINAPNLSSLVETLNQQRLISEDFNKDFKSIFQAVRTENALSKIKENPNMTPEQMITLIADGSLDKQGYEALQNMVKLKEEQREYENNIKKIAYEASTEKQLIEERAKKQMRVAAYKERLDDILSRKKMARSKYLQDNSAKNAIQQILLGHRLTEEEIDERAKKQLEIEQRKFNNKVKEALLKKTLDMAVEEKKTERQKQRFEWAKENGGEVYVAGKKIKFRKKTNNKDEQDENQYVGILPNAF